MYGYDLSSRSRMLKRGLYCLMKVCSVSSASASVATASVLDVVDLVGQRRRAVLRRVGEVAGDPLADRLRLADVDDAPARVAEQVDAGLVGQGPALLGEPRRAAVCFGCGVHCHSGLHLMLGRRAAADLLGLPLSNYGPLRLLREV